MTGRLRLIFLVIVSPTIAIKSRFHRHEVEEEHSPRTRLLAGKSPLHRRKVEWWPPSGCATLKPTDACLSIASWATTTWSAILRLIPLVIFHVGCDQCSDRVLPGWNSAIPGNGIAQILFVLIVRCVSRIVRCFLAIVPVGIRTLSATSASSGTRLAFA